MGEQLVTRSERAGRAGRSGRSGRHAGRRPRGGPAPRSVRLVVTVARRVRSVTRRVLPPRRRRPGWRFVVPVVALAAGLMFATSAQTAAGTDLRGAGRTELEQLIGARNRDAIDAQERAALLREEVDALTRLRAGSDADVSAAQQEVDALRGPAGLASVEGPAVTVRLDDAPRAEDGSLPAGASPDDVVVHQQDVQAVVNALWAGGAEAMTIMGDRVIATTAVRCVGNTLLLHGRVYSPAFEITAIGDADRLRDALDASPEVALFRDAVGDFGLGYEIVEEQGDVTMPAYEGPLGLDRAEVPER